MSKDFLNEAFLWGFVLWLIGYILGFILYAFVPQSLIGWYIMPFGVMITLWVASKKIHRTSLFYYVKVGLVWAVLAILLDYIFLVQLLRPADGYYKADVYVYYALTLILPIVIGLTKKKTISF